MDQLTNIELDALKEVGTVGAGNAATVLATLLGQRIPMTVPAARLLPLRDVVEVVGGAEAEVVGICLGVSGDAPAVILFLLPLADAQRLVKTLMRVLGQVDHSGVIGDVEQSALGEVTNILAGAYLQALGEFTGLVVQPSIPAYAHDMAGALLDAVFSEVGRVGDFALLIETDFMSGEEGMTGHFFMVPDPESLTRILESLGVREGCK